MSDHKPLTVFQLAILGNRNPAAATEIRKLRADNAKLRTELRVYEVRDTRLDAIRKDVEEVSRAYSTKH